MKQYYLDYDHMEEIKNLMVVDEVWIKYSDYIAEKGGKKERNKVPPSLGEVRDYCLERKNGIDPEKWYDHYASNGWKVGKNPMKDWQAAVRTWERSEYRIPEPTFHGVTDGRRSPIEVEP
jgi:hypothetical protein